MKSSMIDIIVSPLFMVVAFVFLAFCIALLIAKRKKLPYRAKVILGGIIVVIIVYFVFIAFLSVMFGSAMPPAPPVPPKSWILYKNSVKRNKRKIAFDYYEKYGIIPYKVEML